MRAGDGPAFLLAQVGAHAGAAFAERLAEHDLTPALAGILRLLAISGGESQQALAERLGLLPSRLVPLVDELEGRGLIRRERSRTDRRVNAVTLTPAGREVLATLRSVAEAHQAALLAGIDPGERAVLTVLLQRIAAQQGLTPGVHPGYRRTAVATSPPGADPVGPDRRGP